MSKAHRSTNDPGSSTWTHPKRNTYPTDSDRGTESLPRWIRCYFGEGKIEKSGFQILATVADEVFSWNRPTVVMSVSEIADQANVSRSWASKKKNELVERGLLRQIKVDAAGRGGYAYTVSEQDPQKESSEEPNQLSGDEMERKARSRLSKLNELPGETTADADSEQDAGSPTAPGAHEEHGISDEEGEPPPEEFYELVSATADGMGIEDSSEEEASQEQPEGFHEGSHEDPPAREPEGHEGRLGTAVMKSHLEAQEGVTAAREIPRGEGDDLAWSKTDWEQKQIFGFTTPAEEDEEEETANADS